MTYSAPPSSPHHRSHSSGRGAPAAFNNHHQNQTQTPYRPALPFFLFLVTCSLFLAVLNAPSWNGFEVAGVAGRAAAPVNFKLNLDESFKPDVPPEDALLAELSKDPPDRDGPLEQTISGGLHGTMPEDEAALAGTTNTGSSPSTLPICGRTMRFEFACELFFFILTQIHANKAYSCPIFVQRSTGSDQNILCTFA